MRLLDISLPLYLVNRLTLNQFIAFLTSYLFQLVNTKFFYFAAFVGERKFARILVNGV